VRGVMRLREESTENRIAERGGWGKG
jgi:hypothetical protein